MSLDNSNVNDKAQPDKVEKPSVANHVEQSLVGDNKAVGNAVSNFADASAKGSAGALQQFGDLQIGDFSDTKAAKTSGATDTNNFAPKIAADGHIITPLAQMEAAGKSPLDNGTKSAVDGHAANAAGDKTTAGENANKTPAEAAKADAGSDNSIGTQALKAAKAVVHAVAEAPGAIAHEVGHVASSIFHSLGGGHSDASKTAAPNDNSAANG